MYLVKLDGEVLHDARTKEYRIYSPKIKLEVNKTGAFDFIMYASHPLYNRIFKLKSVIEVYQNNLLLFRGRVLDDDTKLNKAKSVTCEGELGYFNDTILRPYEFQGSVEDYLKLIVEMHNTQVATEKQFVVGNVTVTDPNDLITRSDKTYPKTWDVIEDKLIKSLGGYLILRREGDVNYLDYLEDSNYKSTQTIELGKNLLDLARKTSATDIYTAILPLGAEIEDEEGHQTGTKLTIESVNDGKDFIQDDEAVSKYGFIMKSVEWKDVTIASNLLRKAQQELAQLVKLSISLELSAIDLSLTGAQVDEFRIFEYVDVLVKPHDIEESLLVEKLELNLADPKQDKLTIGITRKSLTENQVSGEKVINKIESDYVLNEQLVDVNNQLTENRSLIEQKAEEIAMEVEKKYTSKNEFEEYQESVSTRFEQTANSFEFTFNQLLQQITNVEGDTQNKFQEITKYIRFEDGDIILGQVGNEITLRLKNNRIQFLQNDAEVAYITNNKLYITDGEFLNSLILGNYAYMPRANGNLSFKWIGG